MKRIDVFEGYYDPDCGWEFDMPVVMINPVLRESFSNNTGGIIDLVERFQDSVALFIANPDVNRLPEDDEISLRDKKRLKRMFQRAKKRHESGNRGEKGARYWKLVVEWDSDIDKVGEQRTLEQIGF